MKRCTKCGETKPLSEYYKSGKYYKSHCKVCVRAYMQVKSMEWYYSPGNQARKNKACRKWKKANPDKISAYLKRRWQKHKERITAESRAFLRNNPDKARMYDANKRAKRKNAVGSMSPAEWQAIIAKQKGKCAICHKKARLTKDHIIPLVKGGSNFAHNIQGLCAPCNSKKRAKIPTGTQYSLFCKSAEK